jgi:hypothetical protein
MSTPSIAILKKTDAIVAVGWHILRKHLKHSRHLDSFIGGGSDLMSCTVSHTVIMVGCVQAFQNFIPSLVTASTAPGCHNMTSPMGKDRPYRRYLADTISRIRFLNKRSKGWTWMLLFPPSYQNEQHQVEGKYTIRKLGDHSRNKNVPIWFLLFWLGTCLRHY